jgi:hypothetical protein
MEWHLGTKQVCHCKTRLAGTSWADLSEVQANVPAGTVTGTSYPISEGRRQTWNEQFTAPLPCLSHHNRELWDKPEDMRESWMLENGHVQFGGGGKPYHLLMIC